jgi:hypothetical protein
MALLAAATGEIVESTIGRSQLRFTYPAGLTAEHRVLLDTYLRFLRGVLASTDPPNPEDTDLTATMEPAYLTREQRRLRKMLVVGHETVGNYEAHPSIVEAAPTLARLSDCAVDLAVHRTLTGEVLSRPSRRHKQIAVVLARAGLDSEWRVRTWWGTRQQCVR